MAGPKFKLDVLITAIDRFTAPMRLINQRLSRLARPVTAVQNRLSSLGQAAGLNTLGTRFSAVGTALDRVNDKLWQTGRRIVGVTAAGAGLAFLFKREFVDTASEFENLGISLEGIEGSAEKAGRAMAFIKDLTVKTPFEMPDIAGAFRLMRAQGMDPMDGSLQAIVDQVAKVGGTGDKLTGIAMQLSQAWSKGRLMAQDANILAENGIGVWALLERATERTGKRIPVAQLREMSEEGKLGLKAIRLLMEQMALESEGASGRMMHSWTGLISNVRDQWTFFKLRVMESGPFERIKQIVQGILDRISVMSRTGELQAWAERIGAKLERAFVWLRDNGPQIVSDVVSTLADVFRVANDIAQVFGGWGNTIKTIGTVYIAGSLITAVGQLAFALTALNISLAGTPVGLLLLGGAAAFGAGMWALNNSKQDIESRRQPLGRRPWAGAQPSNAFDLPFQLNPGALAADRMPTVTINPDFVTRPGNAFGLPSGPLSIDVLPRVSALPSGTTATLNLEAFLPKKADTRGGLPADSPLAGVSVPAGAFNLAAPQSAPPVNARALRPQPAAPARETTARVRVDFDNAPRGTRARVEPGSTAQVDLGMRVNMGLSMAEAH